jgi:hypothetical protein
MEYLTSLEFHDHETEHLSYNKEDILAYLVVLNWRPIIEQLSSEEYNIGAQNMVGCLFRVTDFFVSEKNFNLALLIKKREELNGKHPVGHPELNLATERCANRLFSYMRTRDSFEPVVAAAQEEFLNTFDKEIGKILEKARNESARH